MSTYVPPHVRARRDSAIEHDGDNTKVENPVDQGTDEDASTSPKARQGHIPHPPPGYRGETMDGVDIRSIFKHFSPDVEYDRNTVHTLNSSQHCPDGIKFVILFPGAHPRWRDYILFTKTAIRFLPGYGEEKAKFEEAKTEWEDEMRKKRQDEELAKKRQEEEKAQDATQDAETDVTEVEKDIARDENHESKNIDAHGAAADEYTSLEIPTEATENGHTNAQAVERESTTPPKEPPSGSPTEAAIDVVQGKPRDQLHDATASPANDDSTKNVEAHSSEQKEDSVASSDQMAAKPAAATITNNGKSGMKFTDVRLETPNTEPPTGHTEAETRSPRKEAHVVDGTDKFDAIDYIPPVHTPIAVFRAFDGNGRACTFTGWYLINKICILPAKSPRIKDLLQDKWGPAAMARRGGFGGGRGGGRGSGGRGGRGHGRRNQGNVPLRWKGAWEKDIDTEWAVLRFAKVKPGSDECPPEPLVEQWVEEKWERAGRWEKGECILVDRTNLPQEKEESGAMEKTEDKVDVAEPVVEEVFNLRKVEEY